MTVNRVLRCGACFLMASLASSVAIPQTTTALVQGASTGSPPQSSPGTTIHFPNKILYGSSYYHEYMPYERLDQDVELMKKAGLSVVRMGESSWGLWEPEEGRFEF